MSVDGYPEDVDDGRDTPPEFTSDGELHVAVNDIGVSYDIQNEDSEFDEDSAALLYDLIDLLHEHASEGDVSPVEAWVILEQATDTVQTDVGAPDSAVLETRFKLDDATAAVNSRPRNRLEAARLALARRVAP